MAGKPFPKPGKGKNPFTKPEPGKDKGPYTKPEPSRRPTKK